MISNNYLKIFSVVIAVFLWIYVVLGQIETKNLSVPLTFINAPKDYVAVSSVQSVSVQVEGAAKILSGMNYKSSTHKKSVGSYSVGDSTIQILPDDFDIPLGVEIIKIEPEEVTVTIDQIASKNVRVVPAFIGDVAKGYKVESVETKPDRVELKGARSKLKNISFISTSPVNVSGISESSKFNIGLRLDEGVKSTSPESVEVRVTMRPDIVTKDIKNIPVICLDLQDGLSLVGAPALSSVKVTGRVDLVDMFQSTSSFIVNCSEISKPGKYSGTVAYRTTVEDVEVISMFPQKINFEIEIEQ